MKIVNEIFRIFYIRLSTSDVFYTDNISYFALATFQVLHCDMWLPVTILDCGDLHDL